MTGADTPQNSLGPLGEGNYIVVEGDCIESLAAQRGFLWTTIWDHPQNAALKEARVTQNILLPGDRIYIPDRELKLVGRPTDQRHRFVRKGLPCRLRLCVKLVDEPQRNTPYVLMIDGQLYNGTTDDEGCLEVAIPPGATRGELTLGQDPILQQVFSLDLGGMDPLTEAPGIQKRLRNLGFNCELSGEMDDVTASAISAFQKKYDLEPTGEPDQSTLDKLKAHHGS